MVQQSRGQEHLVLLQRSWVQFPTSTWYLITIHTSNSGGFYVLFWSLWASGTYVVHIYTGQMSLSEKLILWRFLLASTFNIIIFFKTEIWATSNKTQILSGPVRGNQYILEMPCGSEVSPAFTEVPLFPRVSFTSHIQPLTHLTNKTKTNGLYSTA